MKEKAKLRRRKRLRKRNGDRQFFAAVRHLKRAALKDWKLKNDPEKLKKETVQQAQFALKREAKQKQRDKKKAEEEKKREKEAKNG